MKETTAATKTAIDSKSSAKQNLEVDQAQATVGKAFVKTQK